MALFIGGQADGRRMALKHEERFMRLPYIEPFPHQLDPKSTSQIAGEMRVEEYERAYQGVYVHVSLSKRNLIALLADGYRHEDATK